MGLSPCRSVRHGLHQRARASGPRSHAGPPANHTIRIPKPVRGNSTARPPQGCSGRRVSGCADQASRQISSCAVFGIRAAVPSRAIFWNFWAKACAFGDASIRVRAASNAPMLSKSADTHNRPSVPVMTSEHLMSTPTSFQSATHSCARRTPSECLPGEIGWVRR